MTAPELPGVAVSFIICTRNRSAALRRCLASVERAALRRGDLPMEIVIVDNGSIDGTTGVITRFAAASAIAVHMLYLAPPGLGAARNLGIGAASGALLVFTDDDCELAGDYVDDLMAHSARDEHPVVRGGRVDLGDPADLPLTIKTSEHRERYVPGRFPGGFIHGCNLVIPRAVIARIGAFDPRFGAGAPLRSAEDTDFILRAHRAGFAIEYVPDMRVLHFHGRRSNADAAALILAYSYGNGAIYAKHGLRLRWLLKFPFWTARSAWRDWRSGRRAPDATLSEVRILMANLAGAKSFLRLGLTGGLLMPRAAHGGALPGAPGHAPALASPAKGDR